MVIEEIRIIKSVDLKTEYRKIKPEIDKAIQDVLDSCDFIYGKAVIEFETAFGEYHDATCVTCGNGTDALQIAMMALDLHPGDEIIMPAFGYIAAAEAAKLLGIVPVFVDVSRETFNIDPSKIESKITDRTVCILPIHLFGQSADMESILEIAHRHGLWIIEDFAQATGAEFQFKDGTIKKVGTMGHIGCTSFFPTKNLGCYGDGGGIITNDELAAKCKIIANHGQTRKYIHSRVGLNSRLDSIQAAVLNVKLKYLKRNLLKRELLANIYTFYLQYKPKSTFGHSWNQYTIICDNRDEIQRMLLDNNIESAVHYPLPINKQEAYFTDESFPNAEYLSDRVLSIPLNPDIKSEDLELVTTLLKAS